MKRRLESLLQRKGYSSFAEYAEHLKKDKGLLAEFFDRVTINVSEFFRNSNRWDVLEQRVMPHLHSRFPGKQLNIWSAACSTGEEPYSLALLMSNAFPATAYKLLATDIDRQVLAFAQAGTYPISLLSQIHTRWHNLLEVGEKTFSIKTEVRRQLNFAHHDLLRDTFPERQHLIVCRNVMIYFTDDVKDILYSRFAQSLEPGGVLFVGSTEQIFRAKEYGFKPFDSFFYEKQA